MMAKGNKKWQMETDSSRKLFSPMCVPPQPSRRHLERHVIVSHLMIVIGIGQIFRSIRFYFIYFHPALGSKHEWISTSHLRFGWGGVFWSILIGLFDYEYIYLHLNLETSVTRQFVSHVIYLNYVSVSLLNEWTSLRLPLSDGLRLNVFTTNSEHLWWHQIILVTTNSTKNMVVKNSSPKIEK